MSGENWTNFIHEDVLVKSDEHPEMMGEIKEISDPDLLAVIVLLKKEYGRQMRNTIINVGDSKVDKALAGTFSIFGSEEHMSLKPRVAVSSRLENLSDEEIEQEKKSRSISFEIINERLSELAKEKPLSIKLYKLFFFLHDMGHAIDYWEKYKKSFFTSYETAYKERLKDQMRERETLPISRVAIGFARRAWAETNDVDQFVVFLCEYYEKHYPGVLFNEEGFKKNLRTYGSMETLLDEHERQEKRSPGEQFADNFAVEFLKKYWDELDLDKE